MLFPSAYFVEKGGVGKCETYLVRADGFDRQVLPARKRVGDVVHALPVLERDGEREWVCLRSRGLMGMGGGPGRSGCLDGFTRAQVARVADPLALRADDDSGRKVGHFVERGGESWDGVKLEVEGIVEIR